MQLRQQSNIMQPVNLLAFALVLALTVPMCHMQSTSPEVTTASAEATSSGTASIAQSTSAASSASSVAAETTSTAPNSSTVASSTAESTAASTVSLSSSAVTSSSASAESISTAASSSASLVSAEGATLSTAASVSTSSATASSTAPESTASAGVAASTSSPLGNTPEQSTGSSQSGTASSVTQPTTSVVGGTASSSAESGSTASGASTVGATAETASTASAVAEYSSSSVAESTSTVMTTTAPVAPCASSPCGTNAICTPIGALYNCSCPTGYTFLPYGNGCTLNIISYSMIATTITYGNFNATAIVSGGSSSPLYQMAQANITSQVNNALYNTNSSTSNYVNNSVVVSSLASGSLIAQITTLSSAPAGSISAAALSNSIQSAIVSYYSSQPLTIAGIAVVASAITSTSQIVNPCTSGALQCPSGTYCSSSMMMCLCNAGSSSTGVYAATPYIQQCQVPNNLALLITLPIAGGILIIAIVVIIVYLRRHDNYNSMDENGVSNARTEKKDARQTGFSNPTFQELSASSASGPYDPSESHIARL